MFNKFYTTQMSGSAKTLKKRFSRIQSKNGCVAKMISAVTAVTLVSAVTLATAVMAAVDPREVRTNNPARKLILPSLSYTTQSARSAIEREYYKNNPKTDGSRLYIPQNSLYCVQLPEDAVVKEGAYIGAGKYNELMSADISSCGVLSVGLVDAEYLPLSLEEIRESYNISLENGMNIIYTVSDFEIISDGDNEIGRKYVLKDENGNAVFTQEYAHDGQTLKVLGIPRGAEGYEVIKKYFDSFEKNI